MTKIKTEVLTIDSNNVEKRGFFCLMSRKKCNGYQQKKGWLMERFREGLVIQMLSLPERGFIEYTPAEYAFRKVSSQGYLFIHCLWIVGKSKGKGFAKQLLQECISAAKQGKYKGVAVLAKEGNWLISPKLFLANGFTVCDRVPPYSLLVLPFQKTAAPQICRNGLLPPIRQPQASAKITLYTAHQCPYLDDACSSFCQYAQSTGRECDVALLNSAADVRQYAPSPYGVYGAAADGFLLTDTYLLEKNFGKVFVKI